jgi:glyoxylase-like metal-dependent hydrolase (beta-lactamase superfamily II)
MRLRHQRADALAQLVERRSHQSSRIAGLIATLVSQRERLYPAIDASSTNRSTYGPSATPVVRRAPVRIIGRRVSSRRTSAGEESGESFVKVERLIVGSFTAPAGIFRKDDELDRIVRYPVPAYVIETDSERILLDTGLNPSAIADPAAYSERPDVFAVSTLEQQQSIADQLDLSTLTKVVLSHLHWDHVGGLSLIPSSVPLVIQRAEWHAGRDEATVQRNFFLPRDYVDDEREVVLVDGDCDLLGDGSVELLLTPGHTPGHQSVRIGELVLGVDVSHFASGLDDHRFPIFADDHAEQARSAERLRALRDAGVEVIPGHDPAIVRAGVVVG